MGSRNRISEVLSWMVTSDPHVGLVNMQIVIREPGRRTPCCKPHLSRKDVHSGHSAAEGLRAQNGMAVSGRGDRDTENKFHLPAPFPPPRSPSASQCGLN